MKADMDILVAIEDEELQELLLQIASRLELHGKSDRSAIVDNQVNIMRSKSKEGYLLVSPVEFEKAMKFLQSCKD